MTLAEKRKKAAELAADIRKQAAEYEQRKAVVAKDPSQRLWPDETEQRWKNSNKEYDDLRKAIEDEEQASSVVDRINEIDEWENRSKSHGQQRPGLDDMNPSTSRSYGEDFASRDEARAFAQRESDKRMFLRAWVAAQMNEDLITSEMREACNRLKANPARVDVNLPLMRTEDYKRLQRQARRFHQDALLDDDESKLKRSMSTTGVGTGAELIPQSFVSTLEMAMLATAPLFAYADVIRTSSGEDLIFPLADDTANEGIQIDEVQDISASPQPDAALTRLIMKAFNFTSGMIKVSEQLTVDSLTSIDQILAVMIGERLARIKLRRATLGNGTTQPGGVVVQCAAGITTASATAIAADETIRLQHSVDPLYRQNGMFMAHDAIIASIRLLKDTQGRYLWSSGLADSRPDTLNGQPIMYNQFMASTIATTAITMLYGDFSYYKVREVGTVNIKRLVERYAETLQLAFLGHQRFDGRLVRWTATANCPIKKLTQA